MTYAQRVIEQVKAKNANEPEFIQAVTEVLTSIEPALGRPARASRRTGARRHVPRPLGR